MKEPFKHKLYDNATPELPGGNGETTRESVSKLKPSIHTQPRSHPVDGESLRSLKGYAKYSEEQIEEMVDRMKFTTSTDFQVLMNKMFQGGLSRRKIMESLARAGNPGISDAELQDVVSKASLKLELLTGDEAEDYPAECSQVTRIPVELSMPATMGDILRYSPPAKALGERSFLFVAEEELGLDTTDSVNSNAEAFHSTLTTPVPMGPFAYEPLNSTDPEIRLLRLAKPPGADGLHLSLTRCSLNQAPPYMAVSYCWGDAKQKTEITCNKQTLTITASLDYALKRVFNWKPNLVLWVDGICINQEDMSERASQVKSMGEIYSRARSTVAYLGEALAPDAEDRTAPDTDQAGFALMLQLNAIWGEVWVPLLHLCSQPWFSRSWVLQEVALAKEVFVFYGSAVNGLKTLTRFWELATQRDLPPALRHGRVADWKDGIENWNQLNVFGEMQRAKKANETGDGLIHQSGDLGFVLDGGRRISQSLLNLLVKNRSADATDDRDKIYALLSLAGDTEGMDIEPNYSPSNQAAKLYQDIAAAYIEVGRGIDVLHHAGLPQRLNNLPSWVPDWSTKSRQPLHSSQYHCTRSTVPHLQLLPNGHLRIQGAFVDAAHVLLHKLGLQRLGPLTDTAALQEAFDKMWLVENDPIAPPLPFAPDRDRVFGAIVAHAELMALVLLSSYPTRESIRAAVWRTLAAGRGWMRPDDPDGERLAHEAWCASRPGAFDNTWWPPRPLDAAAREAIWPFQAVVLKASQGYRFGTTACGYMGLFPNECEIGDLIAIIPGANTPFVVRPGRPGAPLTLVGDCYIHGMMRGELLKPSRHGDVQDAHCVDVRYRIRQRAWVAGSTETMKQALRQYFDPDVSKFARLRDIEIK
ncbi:hypothetical protein DL765_001479 [Monosporascus sp. GIB2]|nr:hypothetical protein DL765_001479 [Monosporascus sp. GIB2]